MLLSIDTETSTAPNNFPWFPGAYLSTVSCSSETNYWFFVFTHDESDGQPQRRQVAELQRLVDEAAVLISHNLKFDLVWLNHMGIKTEHKLLFCTQTAEYLITAQGRTAEGLSLNALAAKYLGDSKFDEVKAYWDKGVDTRHIPLSVLKPYNLQDSRLTLQIALKQREHIVKHGLGRVVRQQCSQVHCLTEIENVGMVISQEIRDGLESDFTRKLEELERKAREIAGHPADLGSSIKLSCVLYGGTYPLVGKLWYCTRLKSGRLRLKCKKHTFNIWHSGLGFKPIQGTERKGRPGIYSTAVDALSQLKPKTKKQKEFLALLAEISGLRQNLSMFVEGTKKREHGGKVHPNMNNTVTATGRLSCSNPNLQNIPRGSTSPVKSMFQPELGWFVEGDAGQLEWRCAAFLSRDPIMIQELLQEEDAHANALRDYFPQGTQRVDAKIFNFRMIQQGSLQE